ncbi:MAG: hypothetical protein LBN27_03845 [Prevotellaceae bacterium]|jgi:hypothetical protein|nr:hypothetical protein [Prevotellaceae bacterium]
MAKKVYKNSEEVPPLEVQEPVVEYTRLKKKTNIKNEPTSTRLNKAQLHFLQLLSHIKTEAAMQEFTQLVSDFYLKKMQEEADKYWEEGKIGDHLLNEHLRTPYR